MRRFGEARGRTWVELIMTRSRERRFSSDFSKCCSGRRISISIRRGRSCLCIDGVCHSNLPRRSPSNRAISWLLRGFAPLLPVERIQKPNLFFQSPVGIMLLNRNVWSDCGGYDESLLYWGWMECDLAFRLMQKYPAIDLGEHIGRSFFHLEHYDPTAPRIVARKCNPARRNPVFHPNDEAWGLNDVSLELTSQQAAIIGEQERESIWQTIKHVTCGLMPLPRLNMKWLSRDWPFSLIMYEPKTGHLRRRFRQPKPSMA